VLRRHRNQRVRAGTGRHEARYRGAIRHSPTSRTLLVRTDDPGWRTSCRTASITAGPQRLIGHPHEQVSATRITPAPQRAAKTTTPPQERPIASIINARSEQRRHAVSPASREELAKKRYTAIQDQDGPADAGPRVRATAYGPARTPATPNPPTSEPEPLVGRGHDDPCTNHLGE
jgi:hypothetical protein